MFVSALIGHGDPYPGLRINESGYIGRTDVPDVANTTTWRGQLMTGSAPDEDGALADTPEGVDKTNAGHDGRASKNPRATSHPTGETQAAENAENEPAG
jgi:hypothetical protein